MPPPPEKVEEPHKFDASLFRYQLLQTDRSFCGHSASATVKMTIRKINGEQYCRQVDQDQNSMRYFFPKLGQLVLVACMAAAPGHADTPASLAIFDFELVDTSLEGEKNGVNPDETKRLAMIGALLRERLNDSGRYRLVDMTPAAAEIADAGLIHSCNGCDVDIARSLGAAFAVTGTVQKVSNLILNINIYVRNVESSKLVTAMSADIRGNTDESWAHGIKWLVRHRFLKWEP